ncbi:MAG TPA: lipid II flippase MurJ, partial [Acidimicrobiales bacterium]|nr:lipid II flippase MurJ [Acidimicrobiales bacterium]
PLIIDAITSLNHGPQAATERSVATDLLFLFVPQLACYGFISIATALLNSRRRFAAPMFTPVANNVLLIVVFVLFGSIARSPTLEGAAHHRTWLLVLGIGTTLGVMVQAALLVPTLRRAGLHLKFRFDLRHEAVRNIGRLSGWTFGLVLANQLALLVVLAASVHVGAGAVSAYTYAYIFFQLPYAVVAVSVMAATAPELATHWARGELHAFRRRTTIGLRTIVALVVPAAAGMLVMARPLVALVYGHGATGSHTLPTATSLAMLALGIPGFCVFLYAIRVLQSIQDLRSAFWLYVIENGVNIVLAVALAGPFGVRGVALSISIAYSVAAVAAMVRLRRTVAGLAGLAMARHFAHVLMATAVLVAAAVVGTNVSTSQSFVGLLLRVLAGTVAGAAAYVVAAGVLAQIGSPAADRHGAAGEDEPSNGRAHDPTPRPRRRHRRSTAPGPPTRAEPAGRPPARPGALGPTRTDPSPVTDRERLDP